MKLTLVTLIATLVLTTPILAQTKSNENLTIGIYPFENATNEPSTIEEANYLTGVVQEFMTKNPHFKVLPRNTMESLKSEWGLNRDEQFIRGKIAEQGIAAGAQKLMTGRLNVFQNTEEVRNVANSTKSTYKAKISLTLTVLDVASGTGDASKTFEASAGSGVFNFNLNREMVLNQAHKKLKRLISNWVVTILPFEFKILKVLEFKGELPKLVLIKGGTDMALENGESLLVSEIEILEDNILHEKIVGELEVVSVEGQVSKCKVKRELKK
ncbi:MAG: hypothetical protein IPL74_04290 [Bacteroidetes bacterium]|nr:hypothetical protein [Bacteroidota bacterium]